MAHSPRTTRRLSARADIMGLGVRGPVS